MLSIILPVRNSVGGSSGVNITKMPLGNVVKSKVPVTLRMMMNMRTTTMMEMKQCKWRYSCFLSQYLWTPFPISFSDETQHNAVDSSSSTTTTSQNSYAANDNNNNNKVEEDEDDEVCNSELSFQYPFFPNEIGCYNYDLFILFPFKHYKFFTKLKKK